LFAQYAAPYAGHYTMEPLNCTVQVLAQGDTPSVKLWVGTQVASMARAVAAKITGIGLDHVQVHVAHMGGGFGRRLEVDVIAHATHVAMQCEGHPVQLLWPRDQELVHDVFRPMQVAQCRAQVSPQGVLTQWCIDTAGDAITPRWLERTLPHLAGPIEAPDKTTSEGAFDAPYAIDQVRIRHVATHHPVPVGYWRSVGHSCNAFFAESFLDEVIHHLKEDPIAYRMGMLRHAPRHSRVLEVLADICEWSQPMFSNNADRARGVALHESFGTIVGQVVQVRRTQDDTLVVEEVWCVMDCGTVVNPDTVEQQVQGSVAFAMSAAVSASVQIQKNSVSPNMLGSHMMVHMASMPKVNVSLIPSNLAPTGVGEPAVAPFAPALANAVFALTGHRHRKLEQLLQVNRNAKPAS
jgi:isoquinoline 1-oxidoreductase beta subunit